MDQEAKLTVFDVAERLNVTPDTVRRMCRNRKWRAVKVGRLYRFTEEQYQAIIAPPQPEQKPRNQRRNIERLLRSV